MRLACLVLLLISPPLFAQDGVDWNQWRGPTRDGHAPGKPWPTALKGDNLKALWRVPLGPGYSGPIVTRDRVFVAETRDKKLEVVRALDRATGKQLWEHSWEGAVKVIFIAAPNGDWIRSTPAFDGKHLYVGGMRDVLVRIEAETGKEAWRVDFAQEMKTPLPPFGFVCSPLVDDKHVYVQAGGCVAGLDKRTGKVIWTALKDGGSSYNSAFSSPLLANLHGKKQLIVQTRTRLAGLDPNTGDVFWSQEVPAFKNMNILTPLVLENSIFTSTYGGKSVRFDIHQKADAWTVASPWNNRQQGYMSTPLMVGGNLYMHLRSQCVVCLDPVTGKERWVTSERFGKYWSMVHRGDKMLALDERGILFLLRANPDRFDLLDERPVSEDPAWGHLAVQGDDLFIRELNAIAAFRFEDRKGKK